MNSARSPLDYISKDEDLPEIVERYLKKHDFFRPLFDLALECGNPALVEEDSYKGAAEDNALFGDLYNVMLVFHNLLCSLKEPKDLLYRRALRYFSQPPTEPPANGMDKIDEDGALEVTALFRFVRGCVTRMDEVQRLQFESKYAITPEEQIDRYEKDSDLQRIITLSRQKLERGRP